MKPASVSEMRALEENAFAKGVTTLELMERAGKECAKLIERKLATGYSMPRPILRSRAHPEHCDVLYELETLSGQENTKRSVLLFCGPGNNGGDGFVCARYLHESKNEFDVMIVVPVEPKTEASKTNYKHAKEAGVIEIKMEKARIMTGKIDIVVDALLGIGTIGELRGEIKEACRIINRMKENGSFVVSIDVPTGMDADTGPTDRRFDLWSTKTAVFVGHCTQDTVYPHATICIHAPKTGMIKAKKERTGELWIADIGL